jgi:hypothetical protein
MSSGPVSISKAQSAKTLVEVSLMKNMLLMTLFTLAMLAWGAAQQAGSAPNTGQNSSSPSSQAPDATQTQPSTPGSADQAGSRNQDSNTPDFEGCLGGSAPNYTLTDKSGTAYKLNMPANADISKLASHVGESVQVKGDVKDVDKSGNASIDVQAIGRGTGNCPSGSRDAQPPPKQ